jgi:hypothetical protein
MRIRNHFDPGSGIRVGKIRIRFQYKVLEVQQMATLEQFLDPDLETEIRDPVPF